MASPVSPSIGIPRDGRRGSRRVSAAALQDLEEPRPPGGWNTLERFATSYQRSTTFFRLDAGSPGSSIGYYAANHRPGIPNFDDDIGDSAVIDDDEESGLLSVRGSRRGTRTSRSQENIRGEGSGDVSDHFAQFRGHASPKPGDELYGTFRRGSRRPSMLGEVGVPELLIKEVEDEAGNIIEVVVGQVSVPFESTNCRVLCSRLFSIQSTS
jgi:hypothetical protein